MCVHGASLSVCASHASWQLILAQVLLLLLLPLLGCGHGAHAAPDSNTTVSTMIKLPPGGTGQDDAYLCAVFELAKEAKSIVGIVPHAKKDVVHHMLLFGAKLCLHTHSNHTRTEF